MRQGAEDMDRIGHYLDRMESDLEIDEGVSDDLSGLIWEDLFASS